MASSLHSRSRDGTTDPTDEGDNALHSLNVT